MSKAAELIEQLDGVDEAKDEKEIILNFLRGIGYTPMISFDNDLKSLIGRLERNGYKIAKCDVQEGATYEYYYMDQVIAAIDQVAGDKALPLKSEIEKYESPRITDHQIRKASDAIGFVGYNGIVKALRSAQANT